MKNNSGGIKIRRILGLVTLAITFCLVVTYLVGLITIGNGTNIIIDNNNSLETGNL